MEKDLILKYVESDDHKALIDYLGHQETSFEHFTLFVRENIGLFQSRNLFFECNVEEFLNEILRINKNLDIDLYDDSKDLALFGQENAFVLHKNFVGFLASNEDEYRGLVYAESDSEENEVKIMARFNSHCIKQDGKLIMTHIYDSDFVGEIPSYIEFTFHTKIFNHCYNRILDQEKLHVKSIIMELMPDNEDSVQMIEMLKERFTENTIMIAMEKILFDPELEDNQDDIRFKLRAIDVMLQAFNLPENNIENLRDIRQRLDYKLEQ